VAGQEVRWDNGGSQPAEDYSLLWPPQCRTKL